MPRAEDGGVVGAFDRGAFAVITAIDRHRDETARGQLLAERKHVGLAAAGAVQRDHDGTATCLTTDFSRKPGTRCDASEAKEK